MRLSQETVSQRYKDADPRTREFICNVFSDIKRHATQFNNYFICMLDLLCHQLEIYFMALDAINEEKKLVSEDKYNRLAKSPHIAVLTRAHQEIKHILKDLSMSPLDTAKLDRISKGEESGSTKDLLFSLTA